MTGLSKSQLFALGCAAATPLKRAGHRYHYGGATLFTITTIQVLANRGFLKVKRGDGTAAITDLGLRFLLDRNTRTGGVA